MWLRRLEADRLRNLKGIDLELPPGLTMVAGRNGQGKTSLLEAAYLLGTGRSFRTRRTDEIVNWDGGPLRVEGEIAARVGETMLTVVADRGERRLLVDRGERELEAFLGRLDVVDLTGGRMDVLRGAPDERRRFLDRGVVGLDPAFLRTLGEYRRVLGQRNALLRSAGGSAVGDVGRQLTVWDERLAEAAQRIHRRRREYAVLLATALGPACRALFPDGEELTVRYRPSPRSAAESTAERYSGDFLVSLERGRGRDLGLGFTGEGPHRDDLVLELDGIDLRRFGSAGQLRAAMIALKLAKLERLREERADAPLFLMDDFDSDLDERRASDLAAHLNAGGYQALVASSKGEMAERFGVPFHTVRMEDGRAA